MSPGTLSTVSSPGFKLAQPPNHTWTYNEKTEASPEGQKWMEGVKSGWKTFDMASENPQAMYHLLKSGIVPRPIAFVSTVSEDGVGNLAPFSLFNMVSGAPPVISISCISAEFNEPKDTVRNIKANKEFTVNIISEPWVVPANACSIDAPKEISEWDISGLTKEPSIHVKPPRVRESAFSMECELLHSIDIMNPGTSTVAATMILGSVKYTHVRNDVLDERGLVDPGKLKPVARLGGILFSKVNDGFQIPSYSWKKHGEEVKEFTSRPTQS